MRDLPAPPVQNSSVAKKGFAERTLGRQWEKQANRTKREHILNRVPNAELVCPFCQTRGYVQAIKVLWGTFGECLNCKSRWDMKRLFR